MIEQIICKAIEYDQGDPRRIQHFLKVHELSRTIGVLEGLQGEALEILEIAAVLHDIGIHESERKYQSSAGNYQEKEGPAVAEAILSDFSLQQNVLERVSFLIGHHHSYSQIDGLDYQILVEADFLVNIHEDLLKEVQIRSINDKIFKTRWGKHFLQKMFLDNYLIDQQA